MRNSMRGFIDPYSLGFIVIILGAFSFNIQDSFGASDPNDEDQPVTEQKQGKGNADGK